MRLALALLALAATVAMLRRRRPVTAPQFEADDSEVVGMPTMWQPWVQRVTGSATPGDVTMTGYFTLAPTSLN